MGENPSIQILFYLLCCYLSLPITALFVFDSTKQPSKKWQINVKASKAHYLTLAFQKFIVAFGFSWYMVSFSV